MLICSAELENLEPRVRWLVEQYTRVEEIERRQSASARITDGEILFLLGDYVRAGTMLQDVVDERSNERNPLFDRALYYFAESSFQTRNFLGARAAFTRLLNRGDKEHAFDAFERVVAIADMLGDHRGIENHVPALTRLGGGKLRPDVAYFYGKSLVKRAEQSGQLTLGAAAITQLLSIDRTHKYYARARYAIGAELVRQKRFADALREFQRVLAMKEPLGPLANSEDVTKLRELCFMAIARIHADRGRLKEALVAYEGVGRTSALMPQMLYEVAWLYVQQGELRRALNAIELLLLIPDDPSLLPLAQVLKANVLSKLGRYAEAATAFAAVNAVYEPVKGELDAMLNKGTDFNALIAKNKGVYDARAFLPPLAVRWATGEREVAQALGVANDLANSRAAVADSRAITAKLTGALSSMRGIELFPLLAEGEDKALAIEGELVKLVSGRQVAVPSPASRKQLLPLADLERRTTRMRIDLAANRARLVALDRWPDLRAEVAAEMKTLAALEAEHKRLLDTIAAERTRRSPPVRPSALGVSAAELQRLPKRERDQAALIDGTLREFHRRTSRLVDFKTAELALALQNEQQLLDGYAQELLTLDEEAKTLVGSVAQQAFADVRNKFYTLVLRADVGIIDVAWRQKEDETNDINALVKEQKDRGDALDARFREALRE